jgi:succinate dehydrogenase / fumarate reductase, cytochrome b subunit
MNVTRTRSQSQLQSRPTSPHLTVYKWGPHMLVSILHRVMGVGLATVGVAGFVWWLAALASGKAAYATFLDWATWPPAFVIPIGLSFAFFLHMSNGIRHFVMDIGANYELKGNRMSARLVIFAAVVFTAMMWTYIFARGL